MKTDKNTACYKTRYFSRLKEGMFILSFLVFILFTRESLAYNAPVESRSEDNNVPMETNSGNSAYTQPYVDNNITFEPVNNSDNFNSASPSQQFVSGEEETRSSKWLDKISKLEQEVRELRGQLEEQAHIIKRLEKQAKQPEPTVAPNKTSVSENPETLKPQADSKKVATANAADEQQIYKDAYTLLRNKQYSQAIPAMKNYIDLYPAGQFTENAHYWLGELYLLQGDSGAARNEFTQIVTKFPSSVKVPDAMLKLGTISAEGNQWAEAKKQFNNIVARYPESSAAKLAEQRLQQIELAGH